MDGPSTGKPLGAKNLEHLMSPHRIEEEPAKSEVRVWEQSEKLKLKVINSTSGAERGKYWEDLDLEQFGSPIKSLRAREEEVNFNKQANNHQIFMHSSASSDSHSWNHSHNSNDWIDPSIRNTAPTSTSLFLQGHNPSPS